MYHYRSTMTSQVIFISLQVVRKGLLITCAIQNLLELQLHHSLQRKISIPLPIAPLPLQVRLDKCNMCQPIYFFSPYICIRRKRASLQRFWDPYYSPFFHFRFYYILPNGPSTPVEVGTRCLINNCVMLCNIVAA